MNEYTVLIERDEDGWLIGKVVELPGCHTQARKIDDLIERIHEAIAVYLDVKSVPDEKIEFVGIQKVIL
ncbi:MAG TPA: hypothetical protein DCY12_06775 [Candidatus Atribacteria bacterium]|nr:hypothetical protein [Candidatus Atribacteria bacterium]